MSVSNTAKALRTKKVNESVVKNIELRKQDREKWNKKQTFELIQIKQQRMRITNCSKTLNDGTADELISLF